VLRAGRTELFSVLKAEPMGQCAVEVEFLSGALADRVSDLFSLARMTAATAGPEHRPEPLSPAALL
jgi:hypothetical protein